MSPQSNIDLHGEYMQSDYERIRQDEVHNYIYHHLNVHRSTINEPKQPNNWKTKTETFLPSVLVIGGVVCIAVFAGLHFFKKS